MDMVNSDNKQNGKKQKDRKLCTNLPVVLFFLLVIFGTLVLSTYQLAIKLLNIGYSINDIQGKQEAIISQTKEFLAYPVTGLPFTKGLTGWSNQILINQLHLTLVNNIVIGKDGWLFINDRRSIDDYQGILRYTDQELSVINATIEYRKNWLSKQGIPLLLVVVPNKETIYPEFMPEGITKVNESTRLDQLINYLNLNSDVDLLDLSKVLLQEKDNHLLYYKTDSHWNDYGAYFGYSEIMKRMKTYFPGIEAYPIDDYAEKVHSSPKAGDFASLLMMEDTYKERYFNLEKIDGTSNLATVKIHSAVIYHDSFYAMLQPFLAQHFDRILEFNQMPFDQRMIEEEKPDIVIYIMVERLVPEDFLAGNRLFP